MILRPSLVVVVVVFVVDYGRIGGGDDGRYGFVVFDSERGGECETMLSQYLRLPGEGRTSVPARVALLDQSEKRSLGTLSLPQGV